MAFNDASIDFSLSPATCLMMDESVVKTECPCTINGS